MMTKQTSRWRVLGASVVGTSHIKTERGCDDSHFYREEPDGTLLIAVADGAGSARYSALGSERAVKVSLEHLSTLLNSGTRIPTGDEWLALLRTVLQGTRKAIEELVQEWKSSPVAVGGVGETTGAASANEHAEASYAATTSYAPVPKTERDIENWADQSKLEAQSPSDAHHTASSIQFADETAKLEPDSRQSPQSGERASLRDFATTLMLVCVTKDMVAALQLGDGAIVIQEAESALLCLPQPSQGEYINETDFLTDKDYLNRAQYSFIPTSAVNGVAVLTDGMQMLALKYPENTPHPPFFTGLFTFTASADSTEESLGEFLQSERVNGRTDDDKTLVLAVRR